MIERRAITDRASWLEWRKPLLTASDIAAAAGVDEYRSALQLHLEKAGLRAPAGETSLMRRGRLFEAAAVEYIRDELPGWRMVRPKVFLIDRAHRLGATPDLLLEDPDQPEQLINCQIKIVGKPAYEKWAVDHVGFPIPPVGYQLQVATEALLLDAHSSILAVLVVETFDANLELFTLPRHLSAEAKIYEVARTFWQRIEAGTPPPADYTRDAEVVKDLYPPSKAVPVPLDLTSDNRIYQLLEDRERANDARRAAVAEIEAIDAEMVDKLKGAEYATAEGWRITRKMTHRNEYTVAAMDYPTLRIARTKEAA